MGWSDGQCMDGWTDEEYDGKEREEEDEEEEGEKKITWCEQWFLSSIDKKMILQVGVMMKVPTIEKAIRYSLLFLSILQ